MNKALKLSAIFLAFILLLAVLSYIWTGRNLSVLDTAERKALLSEGVAHSFVELSEGIVHYRLEGSDDGDVVVLVHGFSSPLFVWDDHIKPLTDAGYRVLAFDNYGRGFTDRPKGAYDIARTDGLLIELLAALDITQKVHMVGYSMGGAITAEFAVRHPEKLRSVIFVAPAASGTIPSTTAMKVLAMPLVGEWVTRVFGDKTIRDKAVQSYTDTPAAIAGIPYYLQQYGYEGYRRSLLSSLRHYPLLKGVGASYEAIGRLGIPVTSIWGEADQTVLFSDANILVGQIPQAEIVSFAGYGHSLTYAHPVDVNAAMLLHLERMAGLKQVSE